jgi:hypothetical protein
VTVSCIMLTRHAHMLSFWSVYYVRRPGIKDKNAIIKKKHSDVKKLTPTHTTAQWLRLRETSDRSNVSLNVKTNGNRRERSLDCQRDGLKSSQRWYPFPTLPFCNCITLVPAPKRVLRISSCGAEQYISSLPFASLIYEFLICPCTLLTFQELYDIVSSHVGSG